MLLPEREEERVWLEQLQAGHNYAFEQLYHKYSKPLYWKLLKMVKNAEEADELLQDLFVKVWERREQIDPTQPFPAYLYRIAQRMVADFYRKLAREAQAHQTIQAETTELVFNTEELIYSNETKHLLEHAISLLPQQRKQAFVLCKIEGKSHQEAAEIMGISHNTVHNHLVKATSAVKEYLDKTQNPLAPISLLMAITSIYIS